MDVMINESEIEVPVGISTLGDLLDWVETDYLTVGECITHVYLNGNEALNYREEGMSKEKVANVTPVAIKSGDFDRFLNDSMSELEQELTSSIDLSREIIHLLENRKEEEANNRLGHLLDSIRIFFTIFSEDLGWSDSPNAHIPRKEIPVALERALKQLVFAQKKRYRVSICDVLEYEIVPILESWQELVKSTREHID
jgi:hypothetical protein